MTEKQDREYQEAKEEGRIGTPRTDTSVQITESLSLGDLKFLLPSIIATVGSSLMLYIVGFSFWVLIAALVFCSLTLMFGFGLILSSHEYNKPREVVAGWVNYAANRVRLPITDTFAAHLRLHGIKRPFADGTHEMDDGTLVGMRRLEGRTTQNISQEEFDKIGATFGNNIDEGIEDFGFKLVSQTEPENVDKMTQPWEDLGYSGVVDRVKGYLGEFIRSKTEWTREVESPASGGREMKDYVVVRVGPKDISEANDEDDEDGEEFDTPSRTGRFLAWLIPYSQHLSFLPTETEGPSFRERKEIQTELHRRLQVIDRQLLAGIDGCSVEKVSAEEAAAVLLDYWVGKHHEPDEEFEEWFNSSNDRPDRPSVWPPARLYKAGDREHGVEDPENVPGSEAARQALRTAVPDAKDRLSGTDLSLLPSHFDQKPGYLEVGDQYVMGFWIADHKTAVRAGFAKGLYQLENVDCTITWDVTPVGKQQAIEEAKQGELNSSAKAGQQAEVEGRQLVGDRQIFEDFQDVLQSTSAQAWDISGYVVLRVGPRQATEFAQKDENNLKDYDSLDEAKMDALLDAEEQLRGVVEGSPFNGKLIKPRRWQKSVFEAASPNKGNVYNERLREKDTGLLKRHLQIILGDEETSGPKQRRVLGGWLGALFPPCTATIDEEGGLYWGRDTETGLPFRTNPAARHTGGHMVTAGITRSGKTYAASKTSALWFAEAYLAELANYVDRPNRIYVTADTQQGFLGLCSLVGGEHIPISGETRLNPFDARPPSNPHADDDTYRMAVNFVTEFIKRILRAQDTDPSPYHSIIETGVEENYQRAGMVSGDFIPDEKMPDMPDALEIWKEMQNEPWHFSHSDKGSREAEKKADRAAELLDLLSGFREGGRYENLMGQTSFDMTGGSDSEGPEFYYIDMSGLTTSNDAEKSAMLWLAQHFVTQKARESNDELIFMGDEAHLMLYSDEQVEMILRWLREWARHNSWVWLITQNLSELTVENSEESGGKKQAMIDQFAFKQIWNYPTTDEEMLRKFLPNDQMVEDAQDDLTPALAEQGCTECFIKVEDNDKPGWHRVQVEAVPLVDHALNYDPKMEVDFDEYMQYFLHTDALAPVEKLFATEEELEKEPEITNRAGMADLYAQKKRVEATAEAEPETTEQTETTETTETAGTQAPKRDELGRFAEQEADD